MGVVGTVAKVNSKLFLTFSFVGTLLTGAMVGSLVEGVVDPVVIGAFLGFGVWLVLVSVLFLLERD